MANPIVKFEKVSIFQKGKLILSDISLTVHKGDFVFLIGRTGSGKSSLIKTLYGDLKPKKGTAEIAEFSLTQIKEKNIPFLRRKIGVVFQDFKLLSDRSIYENLKFVLKATGWKDNKHIDDRINEVLSMVGIKDVLTKFPFELSGGEQQRIAIARSLLNNPEIIIADEPTGNLDPQTSLEIMGLFKSLNKNGMTILMATHDYNMILKFPSKVLKCDNGQIYEVVKKNN
ncbi:MAG: ATP-binding cassette domain-containing protein [Flavobacteriaceae bacterium]|nr:ATP-binding cassette domain-containing protein [Flavobacteriaceae bacterium]